MVKLQYSVIFIQLQILCWDSCLQNQIAICVFQQLSVVKLSKKGNGATEKTFSAVFDFPVYGRSWTRLPVDWSER